MQSYNDKSKFSFLQTVQPSGNTAYLRTSHFFHKMLVSFYSSNIPLYIEKNSVEKFYKVLQMELKTYTLVSSKFVFEKIKFKVLLDIQHDFIHQRPEFSKDQASMLKSLAVNYFILKYRHTLLMVIKKVKKISFL